jgi:Bacterial alpha-L-rhamnosidase 6 hairpin glycosidase domain/Alpha-L-rhamnosidase N-terminal domain
MAPESVFFPAGSVWIGSDHPFDLHEAYLGFRRVWQLGRQPKSAEVFITADSRYKLWINGHFVARGPARSWPQAQCVDRHDVARYFVAGDNVLAVLVYQPGYSHFAYVHRGAAGLLAYLTCEHETVLTTDRSWRTRRDPSFASLVPRISIYGSGVEERDLSRDDGWQNPAYVDSGWVQARVVAQVDGYPWTGLQPRSLPLLLEREAAMMLIETRRGPAVSDPDAHVGLRHGWATASPRRIAPDAEGWFQIALRNAESAYWLFDLERDHIGLGWAEIEQAGGQESLCISYAEKIRDGQLVLSDPQTYCRMRVTDRFRLRPGHQRAGTFALRGGRYVLFQLTGKTDPNLRLRFHACVSEYPLETSHELRATDPLLARIITLCEETFRACLLDGFIDSTWRESSQWVGDALPQALIMSSMTNDTRPLRRVIEMAAEGAYPDGVLPSVLPGEAHAYTVVDYNFVWVELLGLYWTLTNDDDFVTAMWPALVKMLDRFHQCLGPDGLLISQPGLRLFLDWAPISRNEPNAVYNLHYLLALRGAIRMATDRQASEAARWEARATALRSAVRSAFWRGGVWYDDKERSTFSQLAAALAIVTEAAAFDETSGLLDLIATRSLDGEDATEPGKMVLASPFMHHYIFEALRQGGKPELVIEIVRRRWGRWVQAGYPTAWENWDVDFPDGSQCHAFSAHPRYHLAAIAHESHDVNLHQRDARAASMIAAA